MKKENPDHVLTVIVAHCETDFGLGPGVVGKQEIKVGHLPESMRAPALLRAKQALLDSLVEVNIEEI